MLRKKIREKLAGRELDDSAFRAQTHYEIGMKLSEKGCHDQAMAEFNKATKLHPEFAEAHVELGSTYFSLGRLDKAIEAYTEALRIRPDYVEAYGNLGLAYDRSGNFIRALAMYMKAIRYRPSDVELRRNLGLVYFNIGSYSEAIKAYQRAIQISPTDGQAHYYLGLVHLDLEDKESAMEEQKKLKELGHDDLAYLLLDEIDRQTWRVARGRDRVDGVEISNRHSRPAEIMRKSDDEGFSALELLIIVAMVLVISGFAVLNYVQGGRAVSRTNAAVELANQLQKARNDSMRRRPTDVDQMAQVKVFNRRFYSVAIDADGDGYLDTPLVIGFPEEQGVEIKGPFPKTFIFDSLGQTVDSQNQRISAQPVTVSNSSGASAITFSETGKVIVMPAVKVTAAK